MSLDLAFHFVSDITDISKTMSVGRVYFKQGFWGKEITSGSHSRASYTVPFPLADIVSVGTGNIGGEEQHSLAVVHANHLLYIEYA